LDRIEYLESALEIDWPSLDGVEVMGPRRLTGPGLIWDHPGAVLDVSLSQGDPESIAVLWSTHARGVLDALGWTDEHQTARRFDGGITLAISAPMDQLYSAVFAARAAWHFCASELAGTVPTPFEALIRDIKRVIDDERNVALTVLIAAAQAHDLDILSDDDEVSMGHGTGSQTWPIDDLPNPDDVDWTRLHDIPVALITGTNGKTTTTRLCAAMARAAGKLVGLTTTDVVQVGDEILDRGDYSGPQGARMLLRDQRVEIACLEVARGGILRRGLPTRQARAAAVINIAADHLGEYGVTTLPELAQAKFAVARGLSDDGILVLNADDPHVVAEAANVPAAICWFSAISSSPLITIARDKGHFCAYCKDGALVFFDGSTERLSIPFANVPLTLNGAAEHNVMNALAAIGLCAALGLPMEAIRTGLLSFGSDSHDNPGRFNEFAVNGARMFVDYAHNPHSIAAVCAALKDVPAHRRYLMISQPGDRSDDQIREAAITALDFRPDVMVVAEIADYLRGRIVGETPALLASAALAEGMDTGSVLIANSPSDGAAAVLERIGPGDLALLLVLSDRDAVFGLLDDS
jgi:UDP-N-acetylmuramyl tripeptide synthase